MATPRSGLYSDPSPVDTPRLPSRQGRPPSSRSPLRPSSARSIRNRPVTPGSPTIPIVGLNTEVKVDCRPVIQHGMMSMRASFQGPGRQILDKSFYVGKLRSKKQELQSEIDRMIEEIELLSKRSVSNAQVEQKQESLQQEVKTLKAQLADCTVVTEKVNAGVELEQMKEEYKSLKEKNSKEKKSVEMLFLEKTLKEREAKDIEKKTHFIELDMERKITADAPEAKEQYVELQREYKTLGAKIENFQAAILDLSKSNQALEQTLEKSSPAKQKAVMLTEQLLSVEAELEKTKSECPSAQLTVEEAREALLVKIRQDNSEIMKAEEKSKELEDEIKLHEDKILEADRTLSEVKGGRMEKFMEMQQKEKKMQAFIDNYTSLRADQERRVLQTQQRISQLLEQVSQGLHAAEGYNKSKRNHDKKFEEIENLKRELQFRRGELKELDEFEGKTESEISSIKQSISALEEEIEKFSHLDESRSQMDVTCHKLECEKQKLGENKLFLQGQVKEQMDKIERIKKILNESPLHLEMQELNRKLQLLQDDNMRLQEEVETRDKELNYKPLLENIRFMLSQLNNEIKNRQIT